MPKPTYIRSCAPVQKNSIESLTNAVQEDLNRGVNHFVVLISSPGGSVFWGLTGYNFLKGIPAKVETHNFGSVTSVAIVLYCSDEKKFSVPHAMFMMHVEKCVLRCLADTPQLLMKLHSAEGLELWHCSWCDFTHEDFKIVVDHENDEYGGGKKE